MAALMPARQAWRDYAPYVVGLIILYILFSLRRVFSSFGNAAGSWAEAATASSAASSQRKADVAKAKTVSPSGPVPTDEQAATFRRDAETLANYLGQGPLGVNTLFKDQQDAFEELKQKYSRLMLWNNKPYYHEVKNGKMTTTIHSQNAETSASAKRIWNYKYLVPYYKEYTNGRDLVADFKTFVNSSKYTPYFKWIF